MSSTNHHATHGDTLAAKIRHELGVNLAHCYQCGKCSAGCPVAKDMDFTSSQALRLLQLADPGSDRKVLGSEGIWLCLTCETCTSRCPQEVEITKIMDFLRHEALRLDLAHPKSKDIVSFHKAFMDSVQVTGRLYEVGLVADYKARSRHFLKDVMLAPKMYFRGTLPLLPHFIKGRDAMKRIFQRTLGKQG